MKTISIPPRFSDLEDLTDDELRKVVRMATAVLKERQPTGEAQAERGSSISAAFEAIPTEPVDAEEYASRYGISINTLRQQKRFDVLQGTGVGTVRVRKDKETGRLMVWREPEGGSDDSS